jgi:glutamate 5-kinase
MGQGNMGIETATIKRNGRLPVTTDTGEIIAEPSMPNRRKLGRINRIVVKVGSGVIAGNGKLRQKVIADLAHDVTVLVHQGREVVMVVSGAVAAGFEPLGFDKPPAGVVERQAAASVGQHRLMAMFAQAFAPHRLQVAQLLMTAEDIENRRRFLSARHTLAMLLKRGTVPIINENDALSDDEIRVGDNDHLSALVTNLVSAQLLVILSRVRGLYRNGSEEIIPLVEVDSSVDEHITKELSETGVGGMVAKVSAARLASRGGVPTIIAEGTRERVLQSILAGEEIGTLFTPAASKLTARKKWIAIRSRSHGVLKVDEGAAQAIVGQGASLLPGGIRSVDGQFEMGDRVEIFDEGGAALAVGLVNYRSDEIRRLMGKSPEEYSSILGYEYLKEIVHRDDMVLT